MTHEFEPELPEEARELPTEYDAEEPGTASGSDAEPVDGRSADPLSAAASQEQEQEQEASDDEIEIVFYASIDTPEGEQIVAHGVEASDPSADSIKLLLPAWTSTTMAGRSPAMPPPPVDHEKGEKRSIWRGCLIAGVAAVIVLSLLGSSFFSLFWFWNLRSERTAETAGAHGERPSELSGEQDPAAYNANGGLQQPLASSLPSGPVAPIDRIVIVNDDRHIETIKPDGTDRRILTADTKSYLFPAWSPDGRSIAAIGSEIDGSGIYVMPDVDGSAAAEELHFSDRASPFYVYWSPDGRQITYLADDLNGLSLNVVDSDGESPSRIIARGSPLYWNWTADSQRMLVHTGDSTNDSQLVMIDDFGRPQAPLVPAPGPFQAPGISPSGRYWAYSQFQSGGTTWLVLDDRLNSSENSQRHAGAVAFNWSPRNDEMAFISGAANDESSPWGPLRLMDAESGDVRLLSSDTVIAFFWSPDGKKIATISVPPANNLGEQIEVRGGAGRQPVSYTPDGAAQRAAQFAPHPFYITIIDVESGESRQLLETGMSPIFLTQFLPYFDQYAFSHLLWSPDSSSLVLPLVTERQRQITLLDVNDGGTTTLAEGNLAFWSRQ